MDTKSIIIDCGQCRGLGTTLLDSNKTQCLGCKGSGKIRIHEPITTCGQCRGLGTTIWDGNRIQCSGCNGSGYFMR